MKRTIILCILLLIGISLVYAQVTTEESGFTPWNDVATKKPALANSKDAYLMGKAVVGADMPIEDAQLSVKGKVNLRGSLGVGTNTYAQDNASIILDEKNKGLRLNQVKLTGANDMLTVPVAIGKDQGMIVYHMGGNNMEQGIYQWNGTTWTTYVSIVPDPPIVRANMLNLLQPCTSIEGTNTTADKGAVLAIGEKDAEGNYYIPIQEDGSYAFTFRLYGSGQYIKTFSTPTVQRLVFYLAILNNGKFADVAEINPVVLVSNQRFVTTYSLTLTAPDCKKGDRISIRLSHYKDSIFGELLADDLNWTLRAADKSTTAARTSLIYWKL